MKTPMTKALEQIERALDIKIAEVDKMSYIQEEKQFFTDAYEAGWTDVGNIDEPEAEQYYTDLTNQ